MGKKLTTQEYIEKCNIKHNNKYDYSKTIYTGIFNSVIITCLKHGDFKQKASTHSSGSGCQQCALIKQTKNKYTKESFIKKAEEKHNSKYNYNLVEYKNNKQEIIIICKIHGEFNQRPDSHLRGIGCPQCGDKNSSQKRSSNKEEFIKKAKKIHGEFYNYSNIKYINNSLKIKIICPIHGEFLQKPNAHLNGYGCRQCGILKLGIVDIETIKINEELSKTEAILYFAKVFTDDEEFYKIGTTKNSFKERYKSNHYYKFELISEIKTNLLDAKEKELKFKKDFANFQYIPNIKFPGYTECFKKEIYNVMFSS